MAAASKSSYENIRKKLRTGDLVLFSGKGRISNGIKWITSSEWSHVGMVVIMEEWDQVVLWESTTLSDLEDIESGKATKGVQSVFLSERLRTYDGKAAVRQLDVDRTPKMIGDLKKFRQSVRGRPYEKSKIELFRSAYDGPFGGNSEDLSSLFCSELVAEAYQEMGLLDPKIPSNEYTPADFSAKRQRGLKLLKGSLGPEIFIS